MALRERASCAIPASAFAATKDVEMGLGMGHESLSAVWCLNTSHRARGLSPVNNVFGDDG
jgi:hypothetical protein